MSDKKISQLTSLAQNDVVVSTDVLPIVDTSATETKKIAVNALVGAAAAAGLTNVDINSGTIDGATIATSDITVGSGKTLNVSAGTLTLADNQISGDKVEGGTINAITINTLTSTAVNATTVDATNVEVTNIKAKDGTAAATIADSTGSITFEQSPVIFETSNTERGRIVTSGGNFDFLAGSTTTPTISLASNVATFTNNPILSGGTANGVLYLNGSKVATSGSAITFNGTALAVGSSTANTNYLAVGGAVSVSNNYGTPLLSVASNSYTGVTVAAHENTAAANGSYLGLMRSRGTQASPTNLLSGDLIGALSGQVFNTAGATPYRAACAINFEADGNQASGDLPARIVFGTVASGSITVNERMRITSAGLVGIGTTSPDARLSVNGVASFGAGTAALPSVAAFGDLDTGMWFPAANTLAWSTAGSERMRITSAGDVGIGVTPLARTNAQTGVSLSLAEQTYTGDAFLISGAGITAGLNTYGSGITWSRLGINGRRRAAIASVQTTSDEDQVGLAFFTHPSTGLTVDIAETMRLDHNGNLGIGTASPGSFNAAGLPLVVGSGSGNKGLTIYSGTAASGSIHFADGTTTEDSYRGIVAYSHTSDYMSLWTNALERMRITSDGTVLVGRTLATANGGVVQVSNGVTFPATQVACSDANTLDDYEEGTWTPAIRGSSTVGTYELSTAEGYYTKIGNAVTIWCRVVFAGSITGGGAGYMQITGIPFSNAVGGVTGAVVSSGLDYSAGYTTLTAGPISASGTTIWYLEESGDNVTQSDFPISGVSANDLFRFTATFRAD